MLKIIWYGWQLLFWGLFVCRLVGRGKNQMANEGRLKLFFKCAVEKFLNPWVRFKCRQTGLSLCRVTAQL